jgi:hypothetical protein
VSSFSRAVCIDDHLCSVLRLFTGVRKCPLSMPHRWDRSGACLRQQDDFRCLFGQDSNLLATKHQFGSPGRQSAGHFAPVLIPLARVLHGYMADQIGVAHKWVPEAAALQNHV